MSRSFGLLLLCLCFVAGCGDENESKSSAETPETVTNEQQADKTPVSTGKPGQVLRHAVFFKFKDGTSDEGAQEVADAFAALPEKIDVIQEFKWGTNNSPEGLDDGYTHCFLLTFKDDAGRQAYIPHPDHAAFGAVLGKYRDLVFVIDYWADPSDVELENELKHAVFFKFKDDATPEAVKAIEDAFAALPEKIDTIKAFEWGINNSPEKKDEGFTHCFMVTFDSDAGRETYLPHPAHKEFVELLKPSLDKVRVLDFFVE